MSVTAPFVTSLVSVQLLPVTVVKVLLEFVWLSYLAH